MFAFLLVCMAGATSLRTKQLIYEESNSGTSVYSEADSGSSADSESTSQCDKVPEGEVVLPQDDSVHDKINEWWYWVCNFEDENGVKFEFLGDFVKFYSAGTPMMRGNSIFYIDGKTVYEVSTIFGELNKVDNGYEFDHGHIKASGGNGQDEIYATAGDYTIQFKASSFKAPIFYYEDGYTDFSFGGDVYYYARPRYHTEGVITRGDQSLNFTGITFFEHAFGYLDGMFGVGWDWFSLRIDNGEDIVIMILKEYSKIWVQDADCNTVEIDGQQVDVKITGSWVSHRSGCKYPHGWEFTILNKKYILTPVIEDSEIVEPNKTRWEGVVVVSGDATGRGIAELLGYCF